MGDQFTKCRKCNWVKPASDFYPYQPNECKECVRKRVKENRYGKHQYYVAYDRQRAKLPHRLEKNREVGQRWREENPDKRAAQVALGNAVRDGKVSPWPVCLIPECNEKPVAHHPDYGRPLQVVWLCQSHHKQAHAMVSCA